jgi:type I restriction enzyme, R subunit
VSKRELSERDICTKYITPALERAGWDIQTQMREQVYLTDGQVLPRGNMVARGKRKFADYVLEWKPGIPLAILEAKDNNHSVAAGMQQALGYAEMIDAPFVFASNGDGFLFHDRTGRSQLAEAAARELVAK